MRLFGNGTLFKWVFDFTFPISNEELRLQRNFSTSLVQISILQRACVNDVSGVLKVDH